VSPERVPRARLRRAGPGPDRWRGLALAVAGLVALALLSIGAAQAETGPWSTPVSLTGRDSRAGGWFPSIAADAQGELHVVWDGRVPGSIPSSEKPDASRPSDVAGWLLYSRWDGQRWSPPNEIAAIGWTGDALRSAVAVDPGGSLHLLYRGMDLGAGKVDGPTQGHIRHAVTEAGRAEQAGAWSRGQALSQRLPAYFPDIVADSQGRLHAVWTEFDNRASFGLYYRRSTDGGRSWTAPHPLEAERAVMSWRLQLKIDARDELHVVYEILEAGDPTGRQPYGFVHATSRDGGSIWSRQEFLPALVEGRYQRTFQGTSWRQQPAVGVDRRGQVILVWREAGTNLIYYQRAGDGQTWSEPELLPGLARGLERQNLDRYDLASDSDGRLHLVGVGYPRGSSTMALFHSEWSGYRWSDPDFVQLASAAPYPEWPRIAVTGGNRLHVVWFGGDTDSVDRRPIGIWHSSSQSTAPSVALVPRPVQTPVALSTTVPSPTAPLPAPVGSATPSTAALVEPVETLEGRSSEAIWLALFAVAGLLGLAFGLRWRRLLP
jgi:hypothetical protein